eukprot:m.17894 g.17894  ORF g.17894 m.17894 type:complete len:53 (+) comp11519_c0_seq1:75-233(+)
MIAVMIIMHSASPSLSHPLHLLSSSSSLHEHHPPQCCALTTNTTPGRGATTP